VMLLYLCKNTSGTEEIIELLQIIIQRPDPNVA